MLAGGLLMMTLAGSALAPVRAGDPGPLSLVACVVVALRRRWPWPVLAITTLATGADLVLSTARSPSMFAVVLAVYTVATLTDRLRAAGAGSVTAALVVLPSVWSSEGSVLDPEHVVLVLWTGLATAIGIGVRSRRAYVVAVEDRVRRAEESRESEALRRVMEERLRIARELHDVVAHHTAVINVQAGVAGHLLRSDPEQAEEALHHVREASRTVLAELTGIVGVLRDSDETTAPTEPTPTLRNIDLLVEALRTAGLAVEVTSTGGPQQLPSTVDVTAFRIVQEALTNVHKHAAPAAARVRLDHRENSLVVSVENRLPEDRRSGPDEGAGFGLLGMSERVAAVHGTLEHGPVSGDRFLVRAELPLTSEDR